MAQPSRPAESPKAVAPLITAFPASPTQSHVIHQRGAMKLQSIGQAPSVRAVKRKPTARTQAQQP